MAFSFNSAMITAKWIFGSSWMFLSTSVFPANVSGRSTTDNMLRRSNRSTASNRWKMAIVAGEEKNLRRKNSLTFGVLCNIIQNMQRLWHSHVCSWFPLHLVPALCLSFIDSFWLGHYCLQASTHKHRHDCLNCNLSTWVAPVFSSKVLT